MILKCILCGINIIGKTKAKKYCNYCAKKRAKIKSIFWQKNNKKYIKENNKKYYKNNKEKFNKNKKYFKEYYKKNRKNIINCQKTWSRKNRERNILNSKKSKTRLNKKYFKKYYGASLGQVANYGEKNIAGLYNRTKGLCEHCGRERYKNASLCVHHKDQRGNSYTREIINNNPDNLLLLCRKCHHKEHKILKIKHLKEINK